MNIVLCGKEVYSLLGLGRIMGSKISKDFFIFLLQSNCWDLVLHCYFAPLCSSIVLSHWQCVMKNHCSNLACLIYKANEIC